MCVRRLPRDVEIPGERECTDCATRWSYYETGSVQCPNCGSIHSVGVDEPAEHTDSPAELNLAPVRSAVEAEPVDEIAARAADRAAEYVRRVGFVYAGELKELDETYLAATELRRVGGRLARTMRVDDAQQRHLFDLLQGADRGERPAPDDVPPSLRAERGLAVAAGADAYTGAIRRLSDDPEPAVADVLSSVRTHRKRIEALDGDVDPVAAERLVRALRDLSAYLDEGDEVALARATDRF
jgi:uncharacterized Zn finger protein (UPF0148 family)